MKRKVIMISIIIAVLGGSSVIGYSKYKENVINKELYAGIEAMNIDDYEKSKEDMEKVLEKDSNNIQAKGILEIINKYEISKKSFEEGNFYNAEDELNKIPEDYLKYSIKDKINSLKESIKEKKEQVNKINGQLNDINNLIEKNEFKKAKEELAKIEINEGIEEQKEKFDKYKIEIDEGIKKIELEEKKKLELEEKKKAEEAKKLQEKKIQEASVNSGINKDNTGVNNQGIYYENKELGLSMTFPSNWSGKYRIVSNGKDGITIMMKLNQTVGGGEGRLISIRSENTYSNLDSVKIVQSNNGWRYYIGTPLDFPISESNPQINEFKAMTVEAYNVIQTVKGI